MLYIFIEPAPCNVTGLEYSGSNFKHIPERNHSRRIMRTIIIITKLKVTNFQRNWKTVEANIKLECRSRMLNGMKKG